MQPQSHARLRRVSRTLLLLCFAVLPLYPEIGFIALVGIVALRRNRLSLECFKPTRYFYLLLTLASWVAMVSFSHSIVSNLEAHLGYPLGSSSTDRQSNSTHVNEFRNTNLSWVRGWSEANGKGDFAERTGSVSWKLSATDSVTGDRYTEYRTDLELPLTEPGVYSYSALIRHDGSFFEGTLVFRTRQDFIRVPTRQVDLPNGWTRITGTGTIPPESARLRAFHLVDLAGDWNVLELSQVQLTRGDPRTTYKPFFRPQPWSAGISATLGVLTAIALIAIVGQVFHRNSVALAASYGFLIANTCQLLLGSIQVTLHEMSRASGTLGDPNLLGHSAVLTGFAAIHLHRNNRTFVTFTLLVTSALVLLSGSHAALGVHTFITFILLLRTLRHPLARHVVLYTCVIGTLVLFSQMQLDESNSIARLQIWNTALNVIAAHPIRGIGYSNLAFLHDTSMLSPQGTLYPVNHGHGLIGYTAELGVPFILILLATLINLAHDTITRRVLFSHFLLFTAFVLLNLVDSTLFHPAVYAPVAAGILLRTSGHLVNAIKAEHL